MKVLISSSDAGKTVLHILRRELSFSNRILKEAVHRGALRMNGVVERFSSLTLQKGDQLTFDQSKIKRQESFSLPILSEIGGCLFCLKPSGLVIDQKVFSKLLGRSIYLVHRLDKETSGVILLATSQRMQNELEVLFKKREVRKTYIALVKGSLNQESGIIDNRLIKKREYQGGAIWGNTKSLKGLRAITYWRCLEKRRRRSLVQCEPQTGRTHQLRVHLSEMGYPILGDHQYAPEVVFPKGIDRLYLHAYRLAFTHPDLGRSIQIIAPLPKDFKL